MLSEFGFLTLFLGHSPEVPVSRYVLNLCPHKIVFLFPI